MATNETEQIRDQPSTQQPQASEPAPRATPKATTAFPPAAAPAAAELPQPDQTERLRAEFAEVASVAAQAARLRVSVDAADAVRKGISAETLRRTVLVTLASRAEASSVIAAAPSVPAGGESPIVRRAKDRAAAANRG